MNKNTNLRSTLDALTTETGIDENDISSLCTEAAQAGDEEQAVICELALTGDRAAWLECARVIADADAQ
jgi:hypothetical protein